MRLEIRHLTRYRYSSRVCLDRHVLRVLPRRDAGQRLLSHQLGIAPPPARREDWVDVWGNSASALWFEGETDRLEIDVRLDVETGRKQPTGLTSFSEALPYPPDYQAEVDLLRPYLVRPAEAQLMADFTRDLRERGEGRLLPLLEGLNARVHGFYRHAVRLDGPAQSPTQTLRRGEGVCRDLAVLFIAACRELGIAARFVSGYQETPASGSSDRRYLHAWAEVYLPRAGWQGYDPSRSSPVGDQHVVVAGAPEPSAAAPIEGSFRFAGTAPRSSLDTELRIEQR